MTPVLHLVAGSNGAGKSTLVANVIQPETYLPFVNADVIAAQKWPGDEERHAYEVSREAAQIRERMLEARESFITETVFSHESKVDFVRAAQDAGYEVTLHVVMVPVQLTTARVDARVANGGHSVPLEKIESRYERLWALVRQARAVASRTLVYDNVKVTDPFKLVAVYDHGVLQESHDYPKWAPLLLD